MRDTHRWSHGAEASWRMAKGARPHRGHRHFAGAEFGPPFFGGFPSAPFVAGRGPFGRGRARRGDVRAAILTLLAERPMHGYEIIQELQERTSGLWRPSPGSVYPTLQLLEDEGLVASEDDHGKRRFTLTEAGAEAAAARADQPAPWDEVTEGADPDALELRSTSLKLAAAVAQVMRAGTDVQRQETGKVLDEARRRIYRLLAEDE